MLRRLPLGPVACAMITGIVAGKAANVSSWFWISLALLAIVIATISLIKPRLAMLTKITLGIGIFFLAATHSHRAYHTIASNHIHHFTSSTRHLARVRGKITGSVGIYPTGQSWSKPSTTFLLGVSEISCDGSWRDTSGLVRVTVSGLVENLSLGKSVEIVGWLRQYKTASNPGQFDFAEHGRISRVMVHLSTKSPGTVTILNDNPSIIARAISLLASPSVSGQHQDAGGKIVQALTLGRRDASLANLNDTMRRAGIAHLLSISGMHLGIFLAMVYGLCRLFTARPERAATVAIVVLIAYLLLAEPRAPLLRSALMAGMILLGMIFRRPLTAPNALAFAAIVLLLIDPLQLFSAGFQLSFVIVAGLLFLSTPAKNIIFGRFIRRRGLMVFRNRDGFRRWLWFNATNTAMSIFTMSIVAYLCAAPLVGIHFGVFSPYAILLSLIMLPIVIAILVPGYLAMALQLPMSGLSTTLGRLASTMADILAWAVRACECLPFLAIELRPVSPMWGIICYAAIILVISYRKIPKGKIAAAGAMVVLLIATVISQLPAKSPDTAQIDILAVGSGQVALLRTPSGKTLLIDAGTRSRFDAYKTVLGPFLRYNKFSTPKEAFISHANTDHFNALVDLVEDGSIKRVYLNDYFGLGRDLPKAEGDFMKLLTRKRVKIVRLHAGDTVRLDDRTSVKIFWPPANKPAFDNINNTSLVVRITCDDRSIMLTGDIEKLPQSALANNAGKIDIEADVLVLPHHGSWTSSMEEFINAVNPKAIIASRAARLPQTPQRAFDFYQRHFFAGSLYHTQTNGAVNISLGLGGIDIKTIKP